MMSMERKIEGLNPIDQPEFGRFCDHRRVSSG